jgi:hypothetical protein
MKTSTMVLGFLMVSFAVAAYACPPGHKHTSSKSAKATTSGYTTLAAKDGGAGVVMSYKIEGTPAVGKPLTVYVDMSSSANAETTLTADNGLVLQDPAQVLRSVAGQKSQHVITVTPQAEGRFYVNLFSTAEGRTSASSFAVQVGNSQTSLKSSVPVQVGPNGERVKVMPVP